MKQIFQRARRAKLLIVFCALLLTAVSAQAFARFGDQDFTLHNSTEVEIHSIYVSPHSADDWEEDILGRDTLKPDESVRISFNDRENEALWDLKVTDEDGNAIIWEKLDLTEISEVTLHYEDGRAWAEIK